MKVRSLLGRFAFGILLTSTAAGWAIEPPPAGEPAPPSIAAASSEGQDALQGFTLHDGWKGELFAAEPVTVNPVAFYVDDQGRVYVCESFRQNRGVTDNRGHDQAWLNDDLAAQTVEDRLQYHLKHLKDKVGEYTKYDDRIRLLEDRDGDGRADHDTVFADHFNQIVDGSGAGVLARGGNVYFTCIPHLWLLRDDNNDGQADVRKSLHNGYGVRVAFRGHDLHGLTIGPDGMLYFSIGDRGYNITTPNGQLVNPESGAVFRCELDGSGLEVFATGLRNPQELAFDDHGNLFTGDNNSDSGDKARWVYVVEGGDTGWRMAYQYLSDRGPFNREKIWHPYHPGQPAYIVPPIANFADGPSGLDYYPGTGLSDDWRGTFFLCDFRGTPSNSGVRTLRAKPKGAFFEVADAQQPIWKVLATDVQFGPDGSIYVSDWVNGWNGEGKGRIYRFFDPAARNSDAAKETARLLGEGMSGRTSAELVALLGHADQRVRLEAQFALADNRDVQSLSDVVGDSSAEPLARMHAAWGLGQIARHAANSSREEAAKSLAAVVALLNDGDEELRAQAAKVVGRAALESATPKLIELLQDDSARVRYFAAMGLAKIGDAAAVPALTAMLAENDNADPILRHGGIMGLAGVCDPKSLESLATHPSSAVRLAAVVALRKRQAESVADYLNDADPLVVLEAARAIHDMPIPAAL
ncbi:MAG: HEAT repeat domain-containing protein, partial [Planctomycetales bacterium]|nr:HEAT repeat domain-containing protein [Planctomycetales bacterium]